MKEELEEEAEPPRAARDPGCPTEKQVEDHRLTHLPFRTWCKWCNLGRGRGLQHKQSPKSEIPVVGVDYFFITAGQQKSGRGTKQGRDRQVHRGQMQLL